MTTTASETFQAAQSLTVTGLTNLASDSNLLAGWQSAVIDTAAALGAAGGNKPIDLHAQLTTTLGAAPTTAKQIQYWVGASVDNSLWPTGLGGGVGTVTLTAVGLNQMQLLRVVGTDGTQRAIAPLLPIGAAFGGFLPPYIVLFIVHNTGQAFTAASGKFVSINPTSA